jgi:hypothetical protein
VSLNTYLEGMGLTALTQAPSPVASLATDSTTNRTEKARPSFETRAGNW